MFELSRCQIKNKKHYGDDDHGEDNDHHCDAGSGVGALVARKPEALRVAVSADSAICFDRSVGVGEFNKRARYLERKGGNIAFLLVVRLTLVRERRCAISPASYFWFEKSKIANEVFVLGKEGREWRRVEGTGRLFV